MGIGSFLDDFVGLAGSGISMVLFRLADRV